MGRFLTKWHIIENSSFCGGVGACAASFLSQDFGILDLDPPNNPTSHYGACHFGYNLALKGQFMIIIEFFFKGPSESAPREKNRGITEKGLY